MAAREDRFRPNSPIGPAHPAGTVNYIISLLRDLNSELPATSSHSNSTISLVTQCAPRRSIRSIPARRFSSLRDPIASLTRNTGDSAANKSAAFYITHIWLSAPQITI
jgi:hypothetical protein